MAAEPIRFPIVGCGDAFARHYRPALEALPGRARIVSLSIHVLANRSPRITGRSPRYRRR